MTKLEFVVKKSDEMLAMRHATAKLLYMNHGLVVPDSLEHVEVTNQPSSSSSSNSTARVLGRQPLGRQPRPHASRRG